MTGRTGRATASGENSKVAERSADSGVCGAFSEQAQPREACRWRECPWVAPELQQQQLLERRGVIQAIVEPPAFPERVGLMQASTTAGAPARVKMARTTTSRSQRWRLKECIIC